MSKLKTRYYRMFCMVLALIILERKAKDKAIIKRAKSILS
jgi:hypothetical protein